MATKSKRTTKNTRASDMARGMKARQGSQADQPEWSVTVLNYWQTLSPREQEDILRLLSNVLSERNTHSKLAVLSDVCLVLHMDRSITLDVLLSAGLQRTPESCDQVAARIRALL